MTEKLSEEVGALRGQTEFLFEELTRMNDKVKSGITAVEAEMELEECRYFRDVFRQLNIEAIKINAKLEKKERTNLNRDITAIRTLLDKVTKDYLTIKINAAQDSNSESREGANMPLLSLLPVWEGEIAGWLEFKARFDSLVHDVPRLRTVVKFQYLRASLRGEPLSIVCQYKLRDETYDLAYNDLCVRYECKRRLASYYVDKIRNYKPPPASSGKEHTKFMEIHRAASSALLGMDVPELAEYLLFELSYRNLTPRVQRQFDLVTDDHTVPTIKDLLTFVEKLARSEEIQNDKELPESKFSKPMKRSMILSKKSAKCFGCKGEHMLFSCPEMLSLSVEERKARVLELGCCFACLYKHPTAKCNSKHACKICGAKEHNTILHEETETYSLGSSEDKKLCNNCSTHKIVSPVMLGTIRCRLQDNWGQEITVRAVLDPGSEVSVITASLASRLGLPKLPPTCQVEGIGRTVCRPSGNVSLQVKSIHSDNAYQLVATILPKICEQTPKTKLSTSLKKRFHSLELADPQFCEPDQIQLLLGAEAYADLLATEEPVIIPGRPTAIRTKFGYVIIGRIEEASNSSSQTAKSLCLTSCSLDENLRRFWEVEEVPREIPMDPADVLCERHFQKTHERDVSGRFVIRLPFLPDAPPLGSNEEMAMKRLRNLERRFQRHPSLKRAYSDCIEEYIRLKHVEIFSQRAPYLLPHHAVIKESSSTTKCRVVFDCSAVDSLGLSLNDRLYRGPPLLNDISLMLLNFRFFKICYVADIKMMYRMVSIHPEDRKHLVFAWKNHQYQMNRLPFGLKPSGYIAGRCLIQLAETYQKEFPAAARAVRKHRYADDFCTGGQTLQEANRLREELIEMLGKGGFEIRRWSSNEPSALERIPEDSKETPTKLPSGDIGVKVLGVMWDQTHDAFIARVLEFKAEIVSKRTVLSYIARIYDVMGFFSPTVFLAKHFMQRLWLLQFDWDEALPEEFIEEWRKCTSELTGLSRIKIPRFLPVHPKWIRLVGFSDASERGMAAAVYVQWSDDDLSGTARLLMSKTKLAPLKTLTVPRLELCAALLLAKLVKPIVDFSEREFSSINLYTDSTVVLAWLDHPLHELKVFVCNRVSEIRQMVPTAIWGHVSGLDNPADLGSRGTSAESLKNSDLWWNGPAFLTQPYSEWPISPSDPCSPDHIPERKETIVLNLQAVEPVDQILRRFSSLSKLQRVLAYVLRFIKKIKGEAKTLEVSGPLTASELEGALHAAVRLNQLEDFGVEIGKIRDGKLMNKGLQKLSPFFDPRLRLVRVGGRLGRASFLPEDARHPFLLCGRGHLASVVCDYYHLNLLHSGPRTTCAVIQRKFWVTSLMSLVKKRIHRCTVCQRQSGKAQQPIMADVIPGRMEQTYCWANCALDFGGPFSTRESTVRKSTVHKSYLCVFVCLTTRAIHIEMVTELTTAAFLAAFHRFTARRSVPHTVYSDRGTNFVGARNELRECTNFLRDKHEELFSAAAAVGTRWLLNVPYGPNFNGCAENGIKSAKLLLKKQVGDHILTFEEFATLLCRVEQVLNSRPISFSSHDVRDRDLVYLTPGHFIIGREMMTPPERPVEEKLTLKDRWRRVQQMSQTFWKTWSTAYLHELMQRQKWNKNTNNIRVGDVVYVKGVGTLPLSWPLGRVVEVFTNPSDETVRVARIKVRERDIVRPVNKLVVIPTEQ